MTRAVDPTDVGLDPSRLGRIDDYLARYVHDGLLPGYLVLVDRGGQIAHLSTGGHRDLEAGLAVEPDTLFRIYSMTKPVTSVAAMMLHERGHFALSDPVSRFIPAFDEMRVFAGGTAAKPQTVPATEPIRMWHLLTHTAGLTYGFHHADPVDEMYRNAGFEWGAPPEMDLGGCCEAWATLPLLSEPGSQWVYSVATDVLGRVVEVISGQRLDEFFRQQIFEPLGMRDTRFWVDDPDTGRLAVLYSTTGPGVAAFRYDRFGAAALREPAMHSGGGGLVSTAGDYHRFLRMLLGRGALDGVRLLGPRTVAYMTRNQLPGGVDLETFGRPLFPEGGFAGLGFGLGFSVVLDPVKYRIMTSVGEFGWGGAASTAFWADPAEDLAVVFLTQLMPSSTYPLRGMLRQLVYQALVD